MAGKEDPRRNFGAVGGGSAPAEKVEAEEDKLKLGAVLPASMPQPLLRGRHNKAISSLTLSKADSASGATLMPCTGSRTVVTEEGKKADSVYGGLMPCAGGRTPTAEEELKTDLFPGGLKGSTLSHISSEKGNEEKDAVTFAKRKAEGSEAAECGGGKSADADEMTQAAAAAAEIKWEEMSLEYIAWVLSQKWEDYPVINLEDHSLHRNGSNMYTQEELDDLMYTQDEIDEHREMLLKAKATTEAGREEFFEFQEWVRETFERNGRVMVPEGFNGPNPGGIQDLIDEEWEKGKHQLGL